MIIDIYQLAPDYQDFYKNSFDEFVSKTEKPPQRKMYRKIYSGSVGDNNDIDDLFAILQRAMPDDYTGKTFGVSDIIGIKESGDKLKAGNYYFCDNIGWQKLNWGKTENLNEEVTQNNLFFSTVVPFDSTDMMRRAEEGNHFWLTLKDAQETLKQLNHNYVYSVYSSDLKKPLLIDEDLILWNGRNIADLLICKINDEPYDIWQDGQDFIYPEQVHINNLSKDDEEKLYRIDDFNDVFHFIKQKGFDHIKYRNTQENNSYSVILNYDSDYDRDSLKEENLLQKENLQKIPKTKTSWSRLRQRLDDDII